MKNFRSSKNLKPVDSQVKEQAQLRMKIKMLEEQINMLQKSNLNIFIPLSEHPTHEFIDYQGIINKLRQQILQLEHDNQSIKLQAKKLQKEKQEIRASLMKQIEGLKQKNDELQNIIQQINLQLQEVAKKYQQKTEECRKLDQLLIQKNVQLKFVHEDLAEEKKKKAYFQCQLKDIKLKVSEVLYSSRIYKSQQIKCICIQKQQYDNLKNTIQQLQAKIRAMIEASKREKISLGVRKSDIGEQIVRLKKSIDAQLGIQGNSKHSEQFLKIYRGTNDLFSQLIKKCQT